MISQSLRNLDKELSVPLEKAFKELLEHFAETPITKTTVITTFVLSHWQEATRGKVRQPPSIILVSAEDTTPDPILKVLEPLLGKLKEPAQVQGIDHYSSSTPEEVSQAMLTAVVAQAKHRKAYPALTNKSWETTYNKARIKRHGEGDHSHYSKAWHPKLGLITDSKDAIILHICDKGDKEAFRKDAIEKPLNILQAVGPGKDLDIFYKSIAISGSLSASECDDNLVDAILKLGMPFFILPHTANNLLTIPNIPALRVLSSFIEKEAQMPAHAPPRMQCDTWSRTYQNILWKRLACLPADYRLPVLEHVHKLADVCQNMAVMTAKFDNVKNEAITQIAAELYVHTLRGITIGIAGFAWYSLGFELGCSLKQARKLLKKLREGGTMTLRDIQRAVGFKSADVRDDVLERLAGEGLITMDRKNVSAVSYPDFIRNLYTRSEFPIPPIVPAKTKES